MKRKSAPEPSLRSDFLNDFRPFFQSKTPKERRIEREQRAEAAGETAIKRPSLKNLTKAQKRALAASHAAQHYGYEQPNPRPGDYDPKAHSRYAPKDDDGRAQIKTSSQRVREIVSEAFARNSYSLDDLTPYRIWVAYRVILNLAVGLKAITTSAGESLANAMQTVTYERIPETGEVKEVDPWLAPRELPKKLAETTLLAIRDAPDPHEVDQRVLDVISLTAKMHEDTQPKRYAKWKQVIKISLLPPRIPSRWFLQDTGKLNEFYDPNDPAHDPDLIVWCNVFKSMYNSLNIYAGSHSHPNYGEYGFTCLDDPAIVRVAFPTPAELLAFEGVLIEDTYRKLVDGSTIEATDMLKRDYGLNDNECLWITGMSLNRVSALAITDVDQYKSLQILQLEEIARRARASLDIRSEIKIRELIGRSVGITRSEPEGYDSHVTEFIRDWNTLNTSNQAQQGMIEGKAIRAGVPSHINLPPAAKSPGRKPDSGQTRALPDTVTT